VSEQPPEAGEQHRERGDGDDCERNINQRVAVITGGDRDDAGGPITTAKASGGMPRPSPVRLADPLVMTSVGGTDSTCPPARMIRPTEVMIATQETR